MRHETVHETEFGLLPLFGGRAGGRIQRHHAQIAEIRLQIAPFGIDIGNAQAFDDAIRLLLGVQTNPAITFLFRIMEIAEKLVRLQHFPRQVGGMGLEFLHAHHIGMLLVQPFEKALVGGGADAVQVRGYNAHVIVLKLNMENFRQDFIDFAVKQQVLLFGEFKTKAGRLSPYFFNSGLFNDGASMAQLAQFYAKAILASQVEFDMLFGPAYKGIPLVATIAVALAGMGRNVPFAFNRKEAKDHGEGGNTVGAALKGRVLIVDDVISAGTSVRESVQLIKAQGATPCGVSIALDRMERGQGDLSAVQEVSRDYGMPVVAIATLEDLIAYLQAQPGQANFLEKVLAYRSQYGTRSA